MSEPWSYCFNVVSCRLRWYNFQQRNYLASLNYQLVNEINQTNSEKHFYRTKLSHQFKNHHDQLEQAFRIISQKNGEMIALQQQLDILSKDLRSAADDYISLKRNSEEQKEALISEVQNNKVTYEQKLKKMEEEMERKYELKIKKRVQQVENQCEDRIKMFTSQIQLLTQNSKRLSHELSMLQQDYRQMLLKNDTIIQESINRELRKRDFEAQNSYLMDLAQYETIKQERNQLKEQLGQQIIRKKQMDEQLRKMRAAQEVSSQRISDLQMALSNHKQNEVVKLNEKYPNLCEAETNTDKQFVPIAMPIDMNLMSEVVSLRQFLVEKIVTRFLDFYQKAGGCEKKTSKSLMNFNNHVAEFKKQCSDLKIILFLHGSIEKVVKVYCPSLNNYSRDFLTIKDQFLRKNLMECQTISNNIQRLFRLLDLCFRVKNPLNHLKAQLSPGELKLLQMKLLICLKKVFC